MSVDHSNRSITGQSIRGRFLKGVSGNPGGRPVGARNRVTADFLRELADHFATEGRRAIERMCEEDPSAYVKVVASLLPKEATVSAQLFGATLSDDELITAIGLIERYLEAGGPPDLPLGDAIEAIALPAPDEPR